MSRRNENIRKSCDEIDDITETVKLLLLPTNSWQAIGILNLIKKYTHRIKRTTWRGDENKSKWNKDWDKYNNAKRINTNQTTTANIDVSTIPYY